jgi:hypothetical protein
MVTATSLPALPDPKSIKDEASASDALCSTLAVVATANRKLATCLGKTSLVDFSRTWQRSMST